MTPNGPRLATDTSSMNTALDTLTRMNEALNACRQGTLSTTEMTLQWRSSASQLPLPDKFGSVLGNVLDRMESSALFSEESCSFSQRDLLDSLALWSDKARAALLKTQDAA